jgi:hypothetical protein
MLPIMDRLLYAIPFFCMRLAVRLITIQFIFVSPSCASTDETRASRSDGFHDREVERTRTGALAPTTGVTFYLTPSDGTTDASSSPIALHLEWTRSLRPEELPEAMSASVKLHAADGTSPRIDFRGVEGDTSRSVGAAIYRFQPEATLRDGWYTVVFDGGSMASDWTVATASRHTANSRRRITSRFRIGSEPRVRSIATCADGTQSTVRIIFSEAVTPGAIPPLRADNAPCRVDQSTTNRGPTDTLGFACDRRLAEYLDFGPMPRRITGTTGVRLTGAAVGHSEHVMIGDMVSYGACAYWFAP